MLSILKSVLIMAATAYAIVAVGLMLFQRKLLYRPETARVAPAAVGLAGVEERTIASPDGERLIAWSARAKPGQPTILYFHGNGGALATRELRIRNLADRGIGVFMLAYRGYGGSTGSASEAANVADGKLAYETLIQMGVRPKDIVLFGESLGTGVAVQVAADKPVAGLILDSPYTSMAAEAALAYPWLPVDWLLWDRYETLRHIARVKAPLLVLHGEADSIVPVAMGRAVFAAAPGPKEMVTFPGAEHIFHVRLGSFDRVADWLARLQASADPP